MKKILLLAVWFVGFHFINANAAITVTAGSGGTNICANQAQTGITPAFTTLGNIVISETINTDITLGVHALVINAPAGWRFNTGAAPTLTFTAARNIVFVNNGGFTATALTVNIVTSGTTLLDAVTIAGLQVQATTTGSGAGNITASAAPGMTGIVTGAGGTNFGTLSLTPFLVPSVSVAANPAGAICSGTNVTFTATPVNGGTPAYQWFLNGAPVAGATNVTFSSSTLAAGNNVRVQMTATGCVNPATAASPITTMTVIPTPAAVSVATAGTYCNNTTLTATLAGPGTIYYQGVTSNGTSTVTPTASQVIVTPGTHTYFFRARNGACWGPQGSAKVTINLPPSAIAITPATSATLCLGDSSAFVATATPSSIDVLQEDFNSGLGAWTITNLDGNPTSFFQVRNAPGYNSLIPGDGSPYMQAAPDATGSSLLATNTIVTSPAFSTVGYTSATLSFNQYYQAFTGDLTVMVEYSTDGTVWTPFINQLGTTTGLVTWASTAPNTTVALPAGAIGQPSVQIRWNYNSAWGWYWAIDNIAVRATPEPSYLWAGVGSAAGLSCTSCDSVTITPTLAGVNVYSVVSSIAGCATVAGVTITVNPTPSVFDVTGGGSFCAGGTGVSVGLSGSDVGVDYQLFNGALAVGGPVAGTGAALDFGLQTVAGTYSVVAGDPATTCSAEMNGTVDVIVNPSPTIYNLTGGGTFCVGDTGVHIGLDGSDTGVNYQLFDGATPIGTPLAGTGAPLDYGLFTTSGTYSIVATDTTTLCTSDMAGIGSVTSNPLPVIHTVTGGGSYCLGGAGVNVGLDGSDLGVNYQLYTGAATVGAAIPGTGSALDFGLQTAAGTYTVLATDAITACSSNMNDSAVVTIDTLPAAITGASDICLGSTATLASTTTGGTWSSSDVVTAPVTAAGLVTGAAVGAAEITYTIPTGCFVTHPVTVNALPVVAPITGITNLCLGGTTTLANATAGGVWTSAASSIASIGSTTGLVNAFAAGITTITYTVTDGLGCTDFVTTPDTVTAFPAVAPIAGPSGVCVGFSITLTNAAAGGVWNSADPSIGSINATSGVVDGIATGTVTISYTVTNAPGCSVTVTTNITVSPIPVVTPITGANTVCSGLTIVLANATSGGVWSSSNTAVATVGAGGLVTGVSAGSVTITYRVTSTAGCSDFVTYNVTVGPAMPMVGILPAGTFVTLCNGNPVNLIATVVAGLGYQWSTGGMDIAGATNNSYTATTPGDYFLTIDNGTCQATLPVKTVLPDPTAVISYNATGNYLYTGSFSAYQWFLNGTAIAGATTGILFSPAPGDYTVVVTDAGGCNDTSAIYTIAPTGISAPVAGITVKVYPNPTASVLHIDAPVAVNVTVMSPDGRVVSENKATKNINVSKLANGVYMLLIYDETNTLLRTERFSKVD